MASQVPAEGGKKKKEFAFPSDPDAPRRKVQALLPAAAVLVGIGILLFIAQYVFIPQSAEDRCENAVGSWRDSCFLRLARDTDDNAYCARISSWSARDSCYSSAKGTLGSEGQDCALLTSVVLRDECYALKAAGAGEYSNCARISSNLTAQQCFMSSALAFAQPEACEGIPDSEARVACQNNAYSALAVKKGNLSVCLAITSDNESYAAGMRDSCIYALALNTSNSSLCARISNGTVRAACVSAGAVGDCSSLTNSTSRDACFMQSAIGAGEASDCGSIASTALKDNCYYQVAMRIRDASVCDLISGVNLKGVCRSGVG